MEQAKKVERTYKQRGGSVWKPDPKWQHRGSLAEVVLAEHWGIGHTRYADVGEPKVNAPSDLEFGIELRAKRNPPPSKDRNREGVHDDIIDDRQHEMCMDLYFKDRSKVRAGTWVFATVRYEDSTVTYWGYRQGKTIPLASKEKPFTYTTRYGVQERLAIVYPDELGDIEDLALFVERQKQEPGWPRPSKVWIREPVSG